MRVSFTIDAPKPADEVFGLAATLAVALSSGGSWHDGDQPVDREAMLGLVESIDTDHAALTKGERGALGTVVVRAGSIDWSDRRITGEIDDVDFRATVEMRVRARRHDRARVEVELEVHPTRAALGCLGTMAGPFVRRAMRQELERQRPEVEAELARIELPPPPRHRAPAWTFAPDRATPPSHLMDAEPPLPRAAEVRDAPEPVDDREPAWGRRLLVVSVALWGLFGLTLVAAPASVEAGTGAYLVTALSCTAAIMTTMGTWLLLHHWQATRRLRRWRDRHGMSSASRR